MNEGEAGLLGFVVGSLAVAGVVVWMALRELKRLFRLLTDTVQTVEHEIIETKTEEEELLGASQDDWVFPESERT